MIIMNIDRDGFKVTFCLLIIAILSFFISLYLSCFFVALGMWTLYFFRDPIRVTPQEKDIIISPADGKVIFIGDANIPEEIPYKFEATKISIFMNIFNVHVNRSIANGIVKDVIYNPGKFFNASFDKASIYNERNSIILDVLENETTVIFTQIAGLIAKRIRCDITKGDKVFIGQKVGIIRFGSRLDIYLPKDRYDITVSVNQITKAGESIIARFKN